jgi:hypothetical protein
LHYALGLTSVVLSAAIAAGVLTFFNPSAKARAYHRAWQGLDNALIIYNTSSTPNGQDLITNLVCPSRSYADTRRRTVDVLRLRRNNLQPNRFFTRHD